MTPPALTIVSGAQTIPRACRASAVCGSSSWFVRRAEYGAAAQLRDKVAGEQPPGRRGHEQIDVRAQGGRNRHPHGAELFGVEPTPLVDVGGDDPHAGRREAAGDAQPDLTEPDDRRRGHPAALVLG